MNQLLADVLLLLHMTLVLGVVLGLVLTWIGAARHWRWVRNFWFRTIHLGFILYVSAEALLGVVCPLTLWENQLRGIARGGPGFIEHWVGRLLYYDMPTWVFTTSYVAFGVVVLLTFILIPPAVPWKRNRRRG